MTELVIILTCVTIFAAACVAFTSEFAELREWIAERLTPRPPDTVWEKAKRERMARLEQYGAEYLTLGFDPTVAARKAEERMQAEAKAAEGVKP